MTLKNVDTHLFVRGLYGVPLRKVSVLIFILGGGKCLAKLSNKGAPAKHFAFFLIIC